MVRALKGFFFRVCALFFLSPPPPFFFTWPPTLIIKSEKRQRRVRGAVLRGWRVSEREGKEGEERLLIGDMQKCDLAREEGKKWARKKDLALQSVRCAVCVCVCVWERAKLIFATR